MRTILPQNTILSRANTVTVDAERFAKLNSLSDLELRQKLGEAMAMFGKTYLNHVIEENPDFTVGQALQVIEMMADKIRDFTGVKIESVDEYYPDKFKPESVQENTNTSLDNEADQDDEDGEGDNVDQNNNEVQGMSEESRRAKLFSSFGHRRIKTR